MTSDSMGPLGKAGRWPTGRVPLVEVEPRPWPVPSVVQGLAVLLYAMVLTALLAPVPTVGNPENVDSSWQALLAHDWQHGTRAGVDAVFTYGPLAYVLGVGYWFVDAAFWPRVAASTALMAVLAVALAAVALRLPTLWQRAAYLILLLVMATGTYDAVVLLGMAALAVHAMAGRLRWAAVAVLLAVFPALAMVKLTHAMLGAALVLLVATVAAARGAWLAAGSILVAAPAAFALLWVAVGQSLADLPAFLRGAVEIARGYNECMAHAGSAWELLGAAVAGGLFVIAWVGMAAAARSATGVVAAIGLLAPVVLAWKSAFVRHDSGHADLFFQVIALAPFLLLAWRQGRSRFVPLAALVASGIGVACHAVIARKHGQDAAWLAQAVVGKVRTLADLDGWRQAQAAALRYQGITFRLPRAQARIGDATVDAMGHQQGILAVNGFTIRHRPVFQSYSVYTPYLQRLNGHFLAGDGAPRFVFGRVHPIDGRFALTQDSQAWLEVIHRYTPALVERGILVLERRTPAPAAPPRRLVADLHAAQGEWVPNATPPPDLYELSLGIEVAFAGRVRRMLHRGRDLWLDVHAGGTVREYRIAPSLVAEPFLISPLISRDADLMALYLGHDLPRVDAIRVRPAPGAEGDYAPSFTLRIRAAPPLPPLDAVTAAALLADMGRRSFPGFALEAFAVEPVDQVRALADIHGQPFVFAHAPSELHFEIPAGRHRLEALFGLLPEAHAAPDRSDGVTFRAALGTASPRRTIAERFLDPLRDASHAGVHGLVADFDLDEPDVLVLSTEPGPQGNTAWDWATWRKVHVVPR